MSDQSVHFLVGLLSGAVVGATVVFLFAPYSGSETRHRISSQVQELVESGKQAAMQRKQELRAEYQSRIQIPLTPRETPAS